MKQCPAEVISPGFCFYPDREATSERDIKKRANSYYRTTRLTSEKPYGFSIFSLFLLKTQSSFYLIKTLNTYVSFYLLLIFPIETLYNLILITLFSKYLIFFVTFKTNSNFSITLQIYGYFPCSQTVSYSITLFEDYKPFTSLKVINLFTIA